jgi:hypothetical protein
METALARRFDRRVARSTQCGRRAACRSGHLADSRRRRRLSLILLSEPRTISGRLAAACAPNGPRWAAQRRDRGVMSQMSQSPLSLRSATTYGGTYPMSHRCPTAPPRHPNGGGVGSHVSRAIGPTRGSAPQAARGDVVHVSVTYRLSSASTANRAYRRTSASPTGTTVNANRCQPASTKRCFRTRGTEAGEGHRIRSTNSRRRTSPPNSVTVSKIAIVPAPPLCFGEGPG